jgi:autotransporter-associated beta strand protein
MKPKYSRLINQSNSPSIANLRIVVTSLAVSVIHLAGSAHAADGTWTGGAGATWDTSATNWSGVAGTPWDSTNGATNRAVFATAGAEPAVSGTVYSNGLSITDTVTIAGGTALNLAGTTPTIDATANATISTLVSGTAGLAKTGAGTLTLPSANTYTGVTSITGGVISTGLLAAGAANSGIGAAAASAANLVINGGTLKYTGGALTWSRGFTIGTSGASLDISTATGQLHLSGGTISYTGSGARTLTVTTGTTGGGRLSNNLVNGTGGATSLVKNGSGTLISSGANTYTGLLDIQAGTVQYGNAGLGGESTGVGHSVAITSGATLQFRHGNADVVTYNAPISGAGKVNFNFNNNGGSGSASLTLGGINSFTGGLSISPSASGTVTTLYVLPLKAGSTTALGSGTVSIGQYGQLDLNGFSNTTGLLTSTNPAASVTNNGVIDATLTLDGTTTQTFGGVIADGTSKVSIAKSGIGTQTLSGALNTFTGSTSVQAGTLSFSNDDQLSDSAAVNLTTGATLNLNFVGTDTSGALVIDGAGAAVGKWGRVNSIAELGADFESALITGNGLIDNLSLADLVPYYWDTTGSSWSSAASWTVDPTNSAANPTTSPTATSVPIFGANGIPADTVELGGNQTVAGLSFISPAVLTLTGGGVSSDLSLGLSGITLDADAAGVVMGSAAANQDVDVVLTADQSWTNANAAADVSTLNALNAGTNALTLAGAGTFTLGGPVTGTGTLTLAGAGASAFGSSVNDFASIAVTGAGAATFSGAITGTTPISKRGAGGLDLAGTNTYSGGITLDQGTLTVSGNSSGATGSILLRGAGSSGTTFGSAATTATFGSGSFAAVAGGNSIQLGAASFTGTQSQILNANGTMANSGTLTVGRAGTVNVGGAWTQNGDATVHALGGYTATLRVNAGGSFTYASGSDFTLRSSGSAGTSTNLRIDGGTFTTGTGIHNPEATTPASTASVITLENGGTFRLSAGIADLFTTAGGSRSFVLGTGGGVVNTNGSSTTLNVPVSGTGGLTKSGGGTLTLAELNTYSGDTTVSTGTLSLSQVNASNESSTVSIASGAFLNLGFGGIDTVDKLFINGVQQPATDYTSAHASGRFTGGGTLRVTTGPVAAGFASWIDDFGLALADQDPSDDPDNDDMDNLLEFVLNGNPSISDSSILPDLVVTATDFEFTYQRRDDSVAPETTQTFQWGTTLATWPGSAVIPATSGPVGVATITVSAGTPSDAVTDTVKVSIPKTEAGGSGKLFGRLQVVKP